HNAFIQALAGIADVLHSPPETLEHHAPEVASARRPAFDPYSAQFAMKVGLASIVALLVGVVAHTESLTAIVLTPVLLVQGSYGATLHRAGLRFLGGLIGGVAAGADAVAGMPHT